MPAIAINNVSDKQIVLTCVGCGRIKDQNGHWIKCNHQEISTELLSHGICPFCLTILYPEYFKGNH